MTTPPDPSLSSDAWTSPQALVPAPILARMTVVERYAPETRLVPHTWEGQERRVALPVTFTPFASAKRCSARCVFCSETLWHKDARTLSAALRPGPDYFAGLERALESLRGLPIGVSLSGLEATDDAGWLVQTLDLLTAHARHPSGHIDEKVLYTNTAGLAHDDRDTILRALGAYALTRAEVSRHHFDQARNDRIMRFRPGEHIREQQVFEEAVGRLREVAPVRLVCVIQARGVHSLEEALAYTDWAWRKLGVTDLVFREFSGLSNLYRPNATARVITQERVPITALLEPLWSGADTGDLEPRSMTLGYYFWNTRWRWRDRVDVTFETSDYGLMKSRHSSDVVHKLIYHANGNLCADWDPERHILMRTAPTEPAALERT